MRRTLLVALMSIVSYLFGCHSTQIGESIELTYVGISDSAVMLQLMNRSPQTLHVRAEDGAGPEIVLWPSVVLIDCVSNPPGLLIENPLSLADGVSRRVPIVPGKQAGLRFPTTYPQQYKGGRCNLTLRLENGLNVGPIEFSP